MLAYVIFTLSQPIGYGLVKTFVPDINSYVNLGSALPPEGTGTDCQQDPRSIFFFGQSIALNNKIEGAFSSLFVAVSDASNNAVMASSSSLTRGISGSKSIGGPNTAGKPGEGASTSSSGTLITSFCRPLSLIPNMLSEVIMSTSRMISVMAAQNVLIEISQNIYLSLFLVGIILRSINVTRGIGAFFIAFSIALYLYPMFVILTEGYVIQFYADNMGLNLLDSTTQAAMGKTISDMSRFDPYTELKALAPPTSEYIYCDESNVNSNLQTDLAKFKKEIIKGVEGQSGPNVITIGSLMFSLFLAQGFALLIVVSLTGGISKILGGDVGIWVIGQITRIG
jgi:hypothetical protein